MYDVLALSADQRQEILAKQEGHYLDFKAKEISPAKITRAVSALANASGGELFVGIEERSADVGTTVMHWNGFPTQEDANGLIQALQQSNTVDSHIAIDFLSHDGSPGLVLYLDVPKSSGIVLASDKTPYVRRGSQNFPVNTPEGLLQLQFDKGIQHYEDSTVKCPPDLIKDSDTLFNFLVALPTTPDPDSFLKKQLLITEAMPTVAGVLLFADEPAGILPKRCSVKITRYKTTELEGTRDTIAGETLTIEGPLVDLIFKSVDETVRIVRESPVLRDSKLQVIEYPREALHEIIANAVLHRDYNRLSDVQVRIFDNRIEIESPGRLAGTVTPENILKVQFARNPRLVRLSHKFPNPPNKDMGEGLNTAFRALELMRLKSPVIAEEENAVIVTVRHERLASPQEAVLEYLSNNSTITNKIGRDITGIHSENKMKDVFYSLRDSCHIEQVPELKGNKAAWRLKLSAG